jgi:signal transduction histidine kinase
MLLYWILYQKHERGGNGPQGQSGATRILIASDARGPKKVELRIVNNGKPFDTQHALGQEAGHFGLSGMRERARRSGFTVSFASKRRTTSVRLEIKT